MMDYVKPADLVVSMVDSGAAKGELPASLLVLRGMMAGALLGAATSMAIGATVQTGQAIVGALVFPVSFIMIVLLGLDLITGNFMLVPLALLSGRARLSTMLAGWGWVFLGNLIGGVVYALLFSYSLTNGYTIHDNPIALRIASAVEMRTVGFEHAGMAGMITVFIRGMLCNWMVCLGVVMCLMSTSTIGKIFGAYMPILIFFSQGFEHAVVNMFLMPCGILLGAKVSIADWWLWNEIPVTLGNLVGGLVFTGLALFVSYGRPSPSLITRVRPAE
jgi:formate/nitrite transporter